MDQPTKLSTEETLDPQDWEALRTLGHRMVDDMLDFLSTLRQRPVWQPIPEQVKATLKQPLPQHPQAPEAVYETFKQNVLPYPLGNIHPRFWGWVIGTGTPFGMLAEMLAAGMNPNLGGGEHAANYVEAQVLDWCKQMLGFPIEASGLLVSGGSMANLVGLAVARNERAGFPVRERGLHDGPHQLVMYASSETHNSVQKAVELMGLGREALRVILVNADFQIDLAALERTLFEDKNNGLHPFCVVGTAGTVNTGAFDDLEALAQLCQREGLWFHVDGAFGALAALCDDLKPMVKGMARADSVAFDLHKWMYMPIEVGCTLVRSRKAHRDTFATPAGYLAHLERGMASGDHWFSEFGPQLSRNFRALKVWMCIQEHGIQKYGRLIRQNVDQAQYLAKRVDAAPELERLAPAPLNIVCFRFVAGGLDESQLDALNQELLARLHESGVAGPSYATIQGKFTLRVANTNHRTRREDFDALLEAVVDIGRKLALATANHES